MIEIHMVIGNSGDGSNSIKWVIDPEVLNKMQELVDEGDEEFSSGDGLQVRTLYFPEGFDLDCWIKLNHIRITTFEDVDREAYR